MSSGRFAQAAVAALLLWPCLGNAQSVPQFRTLDLSALDAISSIVDGEIAQRHVPGAVVLVGRNDQVIYSKAFGNRSASQSGEAMTVDTIFDLASLTKVIATTPAVLQLAERRILNLDAPVARYWPLFRANGKSAISVRQLLTHTSGLPAGIALSNHTSPSELLRHIAAIRPVLRPGGAPLYSDLNFVVLGELVHRLTGKSLDIYVKRHILDPLHMQDSGFAPGPALRDRIAGTDPSGDSARRGAVHDPLAARLGGLAGNAGLFGTASDLGRFAQAILSGHFPGMSAASIKLLFQPHTIPPFELRTVGWRAGAPLAENRAALPPVGAINHLGYTGTGIWIDPVTGLYVVVLSNRVALAQGDAAPLRARVIAAVAEAFGPLPTQAIADVEPDLAAFVAPYVAKPVAARVQTGIDVLESEQFALLRGKRIGLLTHRSGVDGSGRRDIDVIFQAPGVSLKILFSPEHGLSSQQEGRVANDGDARTGLPILSLYDPMNRPAAGVLDGIDAVVVDLQDAGVRFYTYISTLAQLLEAASSRGVEVIVLDRPNPLRGDRVQGPSLDPSLRSFTGYWPVPLRHGLTIGEFARLFAAESGLNIRLSVVAMRGYRRDMWYDETGLAWVPPSPNLTSLSAAILYPGVGFVEGAEVSVGRGTSTPFEVVGAPWVNGRRLARELQRLDLPGLEFTPTAFQPVSDRYAGERCEGVRIVVTDRDRLDVSMLGVALAATLHRLYPRRFTLDKLLSSAGNQDVIDAIRSGLDPSRIAMRWTGELDAFVQRRTAFLLYP